MKFLKEVNSTFIILFPSKESVRIVEAFRLIGLCNSIYKVFSNVLTSRLLNILTPIISPHQHGFVSIRKILDSIIKVYEVIHFTNCSNCQCILLKMDLSKAYDIVDWEFMFEFFKTFGSENHFNELFAHLVGTSSSPAIMNGSSSNVFKPSRGFREVVLSLLLIL